MLLRKKEEIEAWLNQYYIKNYKLIEDKNYGYIVNVNDHVNIAYKNIIKIKVKFNQINGDFLCNNNKLISLEGCPDIIKGSFFCNDNKLKSLEGCSKIIKGDFNCSYNNLLSLRYGPKIIKGSPKKVDAFFSCSNNQLTSLKYASEYIGLDFLCNNNLLILHNLIYLPKKIGNLKIHNNKQLGSLQGITDLKSLKNKANEFLLIKKEKENIIKNIEEKNMNIKIKKL